MGMEHLTLTNVARGMAPQIFQREFERVLENIKDTRTSAKKQRGITLDFIIVPDQERHTFSIEVRGKSKLAEGSGAKGFAFASLDTEGNPIATLSDPEQLSLADQLGEKQRGVN